MKTLIYAFLAISCATQLSAQLVNFGSGSFTVEIFTSFASASQDAISVTATGVADDNLAGSFIGIDLTNLTSVTLVGSVATNPGGAFSIEFFDSAFNAAAYTGGSWNTLNNTGQSTVTFSSAAIGFDFTDVVALNIVSAGLGTDPLSFTATSIIPEPATYAALIGLLALGLVVVRRRRQG